MAQTKSRTTRSSSGSKARSGSQRGKSSSSRTTSTRAKSTRSASKSQRSGSRNRSSTNRSTAGAIAQKAKGPALAGGAALMGLAGGLALSRNKRRNGLMGRIPTPNVSKPKLSMPRVKPEEALKTIGKAAGEVAQRSERIGAVASEVQKASDAIEKKR
jgi:hypothetical protein